MNSTELLSSYCFLASLTEKQSDLYKGVFIPVVKRSLSFYNLKGKTHGFDTDIQQQVKELYDIDMPILIVKQLLRSIENQMSRKEKLQTGFKIMDKGASFEVKALAFLELEDRYKQSQREVKFLQQSFESYLHQEVEDISEIPSFSDFLNKNKNKISSFFKGKKIEDTNDIEKTFIYHVNFLEYIEASHHQLYSIAESLYIGSLVASLLEVEIDFDAKFDENELYYLDTQIVLKALDLQGEADALPVKEILELIKNTGGKIKILDITLDEIQFIFNRAIASYNSDYPTSSINEACIRKGKNKAWLIGLQGKIEEVLLKELGITTDKITDLQKDKFNKTNDLTDLKLDRFKQENATHDVYAYLYVREKRGGAIKVHQKAKVWFLTANKNLLNFNISRIIAGNIPEVTLPDTLACLLWLKNPMNLVAKVKKIGITELIALTIRDEIATKELINEFDKNIKTLDTISKEDYDLLLSSVAYQSAKNLTKLNQLFNEGKKEESNIEAHKIVDKERNRRANHQETVRITKDEQLQKDTLNNELNEKLLKIEQLFSSSQETNQSTNTKLEELAEKINNQNKYIKKFVLWFIIFVVILIIMYCILNSSSLNDDAKKIVKGILALSGIWSFGSFFMNLLKALKLIS